MKMQLQSDFHDYYDAAFEQTGTEFRRMTRKGMDRRSMLDILNSRGLRTPTYGCVKEIVPKLLSDYDESIQLMATESIIEVIVHTDPTAHAGEGKIKLSAAEALDKYPRHLGVEYIPATMNGSGRSLRYLQVGSRRFWLEYTSISDWRSNVGEGNCRVITEEAPGYHPRFDQAMFAIDFAPAGRHLYALDYNIAPGLAPLRDILRPSEVVELLKLAMERLHLPHQGFP